MNILITGSGGMLGRDVYKTFNDEFKENNVIATDIDVNEDWLQYLDVRDFKQCEIFFEKYNPKLVLHLAALTDLEYCETNTENAWLTNALGTENIALLCKKYNSTMVYISTAGIFDGEIDVYNDFEKPNPMCIYAKSKFHGETVIPTLLEKFYIFRAGWMIGGLEKDKKFVAKILKQIKTGTKELFVVDDKFGTPTYTKDFAKNIFNVIKTGYYGVYNQVCGGDCSRYDVAIEMVKILNLDIVVHKVESDYFASEYFAKRPKSEKLINLKLNNRGLNGMRDWKICLSEYINDLKVNDII